MFFKVNSIIGCDCLSRTFLHKLINRNNEANRTYIVETKLIAKGSQFIPSIANKKVLDTKERFTTNYETLSAKNRQHYKTLLW